MTESGRQYASKLLGFLYRAEEAAIKETLDRHGDAFITALEEFADSFLEKIAEFEKSVKKSDRGVFNLCQKQVHPPIPYF